MNEKQLKTETELVEQLLTLPNLDSKKRLLEENVSLLNDEVVRLLKEHADHFLRADIRKSLEIAGHLYYMAEITNKPLHKAMGLVLEADARSIGLGEYDLGIALYDEGVKIYQAHECILEQAWAQIGKVNALSYVGRYAEAVKIGNKIGQVFEANEKWRSLAQLTMNMGIVYGRWGKDIESLTMFDRAGEIYQQMGIEGKANWSLIQQNRAVALRNMGRFDESIAASEMAKDTLLQLSETVEAARAQQGLALTYFVRGRFNESLDILDHVRNVFLADDRKRDVMLTELYISDCLLQLRRFPDVIEKCQRVRNLFARMGSHQVEGLAIVNEAIAYAELRRYDDALVSLAEARRIFDEVGNEVRMASTDLESSAVLHCQARHAESLVLARECVAVFKSHGLPIEEAQALTVAARSALALKEYAQVHQFLFEALKMGEKLNIPTVKYQGRSLLGALALAQGDVETAQGEYELAIQEIERLRGRLMVEFRVSFLEDKESLYQDMVGICIDQGQFLRGLDFAERAKSRALLDLLAYRINLTIQPRDTADIPLVKELTRLRVERDRLYRRWESDSDSGERGWVSSQSVRHKAQQEVLVLETKITELWHRLLVHNADYAREAELWTVHTESAQPHLDKDTLLIEYFVIHGKLVIFLVTSKDVKARYVNNDLTKIQTLIQLFRLNLRRVPKCPPYQMPALTTNAKALLHRLYQLLIAPFENQLAGYSNLIIVPHGSLHYLPFHALYDGNSYLIEQYEISYLPSASSLHYCREARNVDNKRSIAVGNSNNGHLPYAVEEARTVANLLGGEVLLDEYTSITDIYQAVPDCRTIHFAAHGDFRPDNPLFSGMSFSDGWLTTMDIFNLHLKASLVTLSACRTGRNVVGGGDELLGLMRAFLSAGSATVVLTLWAVEDRTTAQIMEAFYRNMIINGEGKCEALRHAQLQLVRGGGYLSEYYDHPYFWAPFFLVGDTSRL